MTGAKNTKFKKIVTAFIVSVLTVFIYGRFVEPGLVTVRYVEIQDEDLYRAWGKLRLVHISDIHLTELDARYKRVIKRINDLDADIVCVTGDLGQWGGKHSSVMKFLRGLKSRHGVYVVLGDSDLSLGPQRCFFCHEKGNIHRLRKSPTFLRDNCASTDLTDGKRLSICGISPSTGDDPNAFYRFWGGTLQKYVRQKIPVLVLSHFSNYWSMLPDDARLLWLSGNTHGGQVWMPKCFLPIVFPDKDYRHIKGLFSTGKGRWLYVNPGLGTTKGFPIRIGVPPEITVIDIKGEWK